MSSAISVDSLSKRHGDAAVLVDVTLSIEVGEFVVVRGPSGSGKTTLLRCLALLERIDAGEILYGERVMMRPGTQPHPRDAFGHGVAVVFQDLYLWPHLSVFDNVILPLRNQYSRKLANDMAWRALETTGIAMKSREYPIALSGGQRQRLALARVLALRPSILLLDEVTANLDPTTARSILMLLGEMHLAGTTIVLVSHTRLPLDNYAELIVSGGRWVKRRI
ncbi:MAG: amino acid ABC transporter ATP-binding protein [Acidobacteriaceae bacterium]|nr:amino acid ABC transporter ATP-binding protein [Acidobacteriaceae bacterium]